MGNRNSTGFGKSTSVVQLEGKTVRYGYYKNNKKVLYDGISLNLSKSEVKSFKKLKYSYAKTNKFVFYKGEIIPDAIPENFQVINRKETPPELSRFNSVLAVETDPSTGIKRIYQFGKLIFTIN
jgi:hypothetical protein